MPSSSWQPSSPEGLGRIWEASRKIAEGHKIHSSGQCVDTVTVAVLANPATVWEGMAAAPLHEQEQSKPIFKSWITIWLAFDQLGV